MIALIPISVVAVFAAGVIVAYIYIGQMEYMKRLDLEAQLSTLRARDLPPRVLEVWSHNRDGGNHGIYMRSIDADLAVEVLALVGAGVRTFSEEGLSGVLTRRQLKALRHELIEMELARWNPSDRRQGIVWTPAGESLLEICKNQGVRTHTYALSMYNRRIPAGGVGEGNA